MQTQSEQRILSEHDVLDRISRRETFEGCLDGSLHIKIQDYVPFLATAVHAGHNLRSELIKKCALTEEERIYGEDLFTDELISAFPITLSVLDSRYEYDLNRAPEQAVYHEAWGKMVWRRPLTERQKQASLEKHARYYRILKALLGTLNSIYGNSFLLDLHTYNYKRLTTLDSFSETIPVFNIGTWRMNTSRWGSTLAAFESRLCGITLPNLRTTVAQDQVFQGKGYQAAFCRKHARDTLVLPLDVAKVYMDEETGQPYPLVLEALGDQLYHACLDTVGQFAKKQKLNLRKQDLVSSDLEPAVLAVDKQLYRMARNLNTLSYVNPVNLHSEKKRFLANPTGYEPQFRYRQLQIDPYDYREKLYRLPVSDIQDPLLRSLYRDVVDSYGNKVEMLTHLGTEQFLYNSLRYYGQPDEHDIANAHFLLHAPEIDIDPDLLVKLTAREALPLFQAAVAERKLDVSVQISRKIVAKAMVDGEKRQLLINESAQFSRLDIRALIHHEIDVHLYTTFNASQQPLKVLALGLPGNTHTQEGLAIFNEYMSGGLSVGRLQILGLRVLAVNMLMKGYRFSQIYRVLVEEYQLDKDTAFSLVMRVTRGGGFTKDYVYLTGLRDVLKCYSEHDLAPLFVGKTSLKYRETLTELLERKILVQPRHLPDFSAPADHHPVLDYLLTALR
ncbi:flavohemoglobin expression-modulating QEGLA motif protein [Parendozoicomonas haliclonae]|uniref:N-formylglutamate amidohydrolase n=1 Tax=Parendozoicomonas haliclonae TaxID=1960125 RepID=A0A1X7ASK3_9GAMM|nr:flavohemoglobin expression-modulating QEGLA motif protein [Parendozoicomonas haliclonae]SMA50397.1 N-formylglutamate amidohydrolase [Parendozoicomonas haliclonae]